MKKVLSLVLIGMLCLTIVGCGNNDNNSNNFNDNNSQNNNSDSEFTTLTNNLEKIYSELREEESKGNTLDIEKFVNVDPLGLDPKIIWNKTGTTLETVIVNDKSVDKELSIEIIVSIPRLPEELKKALQDNGYSCIYVEVIKDKNGNNTPIEVVNSNLMFFKDSTKIKFRSFWKSVVVGVNQVDKGKGVAVLKGSDGYALLGSSSYINLDTKTNEQIYFYNTGSISEYDKLSSESFDPTSEHLQMLIEALAK